MRWTSSGRCLAAALLPGVLFFSAGPDARAQQAPPPAPIVSQVPAPAPELRFVVALDPGHGGTDLGAALGPGVLEKNVTLALAERVHALLNGRGVSSVLARDSDTAVVATARAVLVNQARPAACILLHATATGAGVHLFTSSLPAADTRTTGSARPVFLPWKTAQATHATQSLRLESDINAELAARHIPALLDRTSMATLDTLACPAIALEVAPLDANTPASDPAYQEKIAQALTAALLDWRRDWRMQP